MVSLMQNEDKTDNEKTMTTFLFDDFSAPRESRMFIFWRFHEVTTHP